MSERMMILPMQDTAKGYCSNSFLQPASQSAK